MKFNIILNFAAAVDSLVSSSVPAAAELGGCARRLRDIQWTQRNTANTCVLLHSSHSASRYLLPP